MENNFLCIKIEDIKGLGVDEYIDFIFLAKKDCVFVDTNKTVHPYCAKKLARLVRYQFFIYGPVKIRVA